MIDSHCHLNNWYVNNNLNLLIDRYISLRGKALIDTHTTLEENNNFNKYFQKNRSDIPVFYTLGFHPEYISQEQKIPGIEEIKPNPLLVGIGETGIDIYNLEESRIESVLQQQIDLFIKHCTRAKNLGLPVIIHCRGRNYNDFSPYTSIYKILTEQFPDLYCYFHSYVGDTNTLKLLLQLNSVFGVNGICTYSNTEIIQESLLEIPMERILLETDSPFLIPSNSDRKLLLNAKENEPSSVFDIAKYVAKKRKVSVEKLLEITERNTIKFFGLQIG